MMEDYENELLADFVSDEEEEQTEYPQEQQQEQQQEHENTNSDAVAKQSDDDELSLSKSNEKDVLEAVISRTGNGAINDLLSHVDVSNVQDITNISQIKPIIPILKEKIRLYSDTETSDYLDLLSSIQKDTETDEYKFILQVNELSNVIANEIAVIHKFIKIHYKVVFGELETLILNPVDYARIVLVVQQNLKGIKEYEDQLRQITTNEKVLVIIMAALQQANSQFRLSDDDFLKIMDACLLMIELNQISVELSQFISLKLSKFAPNVSAIVGPLTASQLLIATGSLRQLSLTPSCNLPSLGVKDLSSQTKTKSNFIRATGYLYHCDLINFLPQEVMKQAMRIVSAKVILAARIDLSGSCPSGDIGHKYRDEIQNKLEKLLTPPEAQASKALPAPIEVTSKKRGGRRFRKTKERFQMSELRKAQNKMAFGEQEETMMNSMGEEIGLGMSKSGSGGRLNISINTNTNAKMSKAMISRLQQQRHKSSNMDLDSFTLSNPDLPPSHDRGVPDSSPHQGALPTLSGITDSKWFTGLNKRPHEQTSESPDESKTKKIKF